MKNYKKHIIMLIVCLLYIFYVFIWYKQFSFSNYSGTDEDLYNEAGVGNAEEAEEREFELDENYSIRLHRTTFWATEYSDITIENGSEDTVQLTISDYYGECVDAMPQPVVLMPGESCNFVADDRLGFVLTLYGGYEDQSIEGVSLHHDNAAYMNRWKKAITYLLCVLCFVSFVSLLCLFIFKREYTKVSPYVFMALGGLGLVLLEISKYTVAEDWSYKPLQMGAAFMAVMAFLSGIEFNDAQDTCDDKTKIRVPAFWGLVSIAMALILQFLFLISKQGSLLYFFNGGLDAKRRIMGYVFVVGVFIFSYLLLGHIKISERLIRNFRCCFSVKTALYSTVLLLFILAENWLVGNPLRLVFMAVLALTAGFWNRVKFNKAVLILYTAFVVILIALNSCVINFWDTGIWANVYHVSSFYNSLLPVAENVPFASGMNEIYGHYALFYKIPLLLFGNSLCTVGWTTGVFAALGALAAMLSVSRLLKNDISKILIGIIFTVSMITDYLYPMTFPLRMEWSFILLAYCILLKDRCTKLMAKAGGYLICAMAMICNPESGAVCLICWCVYIVIRSQESVDIKKSFLLLMKESVYMAVAVLLAYSSVKVYNYLMDPSVGFIAEFMNWQKEFGLVAKYETGDTNDGQLFWTNAPWMYIEIALFTISFVLIKKLGLFGSEKYHSSDAQKALFLIFSVGIFSYWMYRPEEYNIIMPYIGCLLVMVYDGFVSALDREHKEKSNIHVIALLCTSLGIACFIAMVPTAATSTKHNLVDGQIMNYGKVCEYMQYFDENVPEDAYMEALGTSMIAMTTGRELEGDPRVETPEDVLIENTKDKEWIVLDRSNWNAPGMVLYREIPFGGYTYYLYHNEGVK